MQHKPIETCREVNTSTCIPFLLTLTTLPASTPSSSPEGIPLLKEEKKNPTRCSIGERVILTPNTKRRLIYLRCCKRYEEDAEGCFRVEQLLRVAVDTTVLLLHLEVSLANLARYFCDLGPFGDRTPISRPSLERGKKLRSFPRFACNLFSFILASSQIAFECKRPTRPSQASTFIKF